MEVEPRAAAGSPPVLIKPVSREQEETGHTNGSWRGSLREQFVQGRQAGSAEYLCPLRRLTHLSVVSQTNLAMVSSR